MVGSHLLMPPYLAGNTRFVEEKYRLQERTILTDL